MTLKVKYCVYSVFILFTAGKLFSLIKKKKHLPPCKRSAQVDGRPGLSLSTCSPSVLLHVGMQGHAVQLNSVGGPRRVMSTNRVAQCVDLKGKLTRRWDSQTEKHGHMFASYLFSREMCPFQEMPLFNV